MKIAIIIVRILMGLMFLMASVVYFFDLVEVPEMQGDVKTFNEGLAVAVYMMPLIKGIEFLCALAFLSGRFVALAAVVIFPIVINILLFHAFLTPDLTIAIPLFLGNVFLLYACRYKYAPMFESK
ncbi:MAG TPA: DoxX family protein [Flavobacterium sp.]|jgi:uncharacterized membrane protein YphA (DoxX/SURF4 family)